MKKIIHFIILFTLWGCLPKNNITIEPTPATVEIGFEKNCAEIISVEDSPLTFTNERLILLDEHGNEDKLVSIVFENGKEVKENFFTPDANSKINILAINKNGTRLALHTDDASQSGQEQGSIIILDQSGKIISSFTNIDYKAKSRAFWIDESQLAIEKIYNQEWHILNISTMEKKVISFTLDFFENKAETLLSPNTQQVIAYPISASMGGEGNVALINLDPMELIWSGNLYADIHHLSAAWAPDGEKATVFAFTSKDGDVNLGRYLLSVISSNGSVEYSIDFLDYSVKPLIPLFMEWSPKDEKVILSLSTSTISPQSFAILDVKNKQVKDYCISMGYEEAQWSPDGNYIVGGMEDGTTLIYAVNNNIAYLWNVEYDKSSFVWMINPK